VSRLSGCAFFLARFCRCMFTVSSSRRLPKGTAITGPPQLRRFRIGKSVDVYMFSAFVNMFSALAAIFRSARGSIQKFAVQRVQVSFTARCYRCYSIYFIYFLHVFTSVI